LTSRTFPELLPSIFNKRFGRLFKMAIVVQMSTVKKAETEIQSSQVKSMIYYGSG